jgi:hypothetical protein
MPPALGGEQSIARIELCLPCTANSVLAITPNFLLPELPSLDSPLSLLLSW